MGTLGLINSIDIPLEAQTKRKFSEHFFKLGVNASGFTEGNLRSIFIEFSSYLSGEKISHDAKSKVFRSRKRIHTLVSTTKGDPGDGR